MGPWDLNWCGRVGFIGLRIYHGYLAIRRYLALGIINNKICYLSIDLVIMIMSYSPVILHKPSAPIVLCDGYDISGIRILWHQTRQPPVAPLPLASCIKPRAGPLCSNPNH